MASHRFQPVAVGAALLLVTAIFAPNSSAQSEGIPTGSGDAGGPIAAVGQSVSTLGNPLGSVFGSAGESSAPLEQTLGSANGSLGNPGPVAPFSLQFSCRPTAANPRPVLLLHGTYGNADHLGNSELAKMLTSRGSCVVAPTYGAYAFSPGRGGLTSMQDVSAPQIATAIDTILARTGAPAVDIVGYSQGAALAGYLAKVVRPARIGTVVSLAGYWGANPSALLPYGIDPSTSGSLLDIANQKGLAELMPGSEFMTTWMAPNGTPFAAGRKYELIASTTDSVMNPELSFPTAAQLSAGRAAGAQINLTVLQNGCSVDRASHDTIMNDPRVADLVTNALNPSAQVPVRCSAFA